MKKYLIMTFGAFLTFFANIALAKDCVRPIEKVRAQGQGTANVVYIEHGDGHANSGLQLANVENNEHNVNRILSLLLAAHMGGKSVTFRYIGTGATCTPTATQQFVGVYVE